MDEGAFEELIYGFSETSEANETSLSDVASHPSADQLCSDGFTGEGLKAGHFDNPKMSDPAKPRFGGVSGKWGSVSSDRDSGRSSGLLSPRNGSDHTQATLKDASYRLSGIDDESQSHRSISSISKTYTSSQDELDKVLSEERDEDVLSPRSSLSYNGSPSDFSLTTMRQGTASAQHRSLVDLKISGTSSPSSRGASPTPDQVYGNPRKAGGSSDARAFLVEKEVIESQLRKLQVENSSLRSENKLLKDKNNRAQSRIQHLESQLRAVQTEADMLHSEMSDEVTTIKRRNRDRSERDRGELEDQIVKLTKELEMMKAENSSLEKQLDNCRRSSDMGATTDRSRIIEGYRTEATALREELERNKQLLSQCERDRQSEVDKRKEASAQVVKLTEVKALLQQQIENSGAGTVAEKQVKSIERRLKITEDRLHQERADRASKLSEMEEKLINDNARLQVSEKELRRQLQREKDRHKNLDIKYKDIREENERLRVELDERPNSFDQSNFQSRLANLRSNRKLSEETKVILDEVQKESGVGELQEQEIIWLLWHQKTELSRQLKDWEFSMDKLKIDHKNIKEVLEHTFEDHRELETNAQRYKDNYEDVSKEKIEIENTLRQQLKDIVQEKHGAIAKAKNLEDMNIAIQAENESLQSSLRMAYGLSPNKMGEVNTWEAQVETLKAELRTSKGELHAAVRAKQQSEGEVQSLRPQLQGKTEALEEALRELERLNSQLNNASWDQHKQTKIEKLNAEVRGLQAEVQMWQEKHSSVGRERAQLEEQIHSLNKQLTRSKHTSEQAGGAIDKQEFDRELQEKDSQIMKVTVQYNEIENELQRNKQLLLLQEQHNDELVSQMDQLQTQLRQKTRHVEKICNSESETNVELKSMRETLNMGNTEMSEKVNELKMAKVEANRLQYQVEKLEEDRAFQEKLLSQNLAELIKSGELSSALYPDLSTISASTDTLTDAETKLRLIQLDKQKVQRELEHATQTMDDMMKENVELVNKARELHQELVKERALVCQLTSEKVEVQQHLHIAVEERDTAGREKERLTATVNKHERLTVDAINKLQHEANRASLEQDPKYHQLDPEGRKLMIELGTAKRLLEAREKEVDLLRDTIHHQKQEINSLQQRIGSVKEEHLAAQENVERLTTDLTTKMKEKAIAAESSQLVQGSERARLELERYKREKDRGMENIELERRVQEVNLLQNKMEKAHDKQRDLENQLHQKETKTVALETELKHVSRNLQEMQNERTEMKLQAENLNYEIRSLACLNSSLEQRLTSEKSELYEEQSNRTHLKEELNHACQQVQMIRREYSLMNTNYQTEKTSLESLNEKLKAEEERLFRLEDRLRTKELEIETLNAHVSEARSTAEQYKKDKQTLYQDVQDLCHKLSDKDEKIARMQEKCNESVESLQHELRSEKSIMAQEKQRLETEIIRVKEELVDHRDRLRDKEREIQGISLTTQELHSQSKSREELLQQITELNIALVDAKGTVISLQSENSRLVEHSKHQQDSLDKTRETNRSIKEQLRTQNDQHAKEATQAKWNFSEKLLTFDTEKAELQDRLNKALANLKATEVSLAAVMETKESLYASNKSFKKSIETLKNQLHEEITCRKLAEQRSDSLSSRLEEVRGKKTGFDERNAELKSQLARVETELSQEKAKYRKLKQDLTGVQNNTSSQEAHAQSLHLQVTELQSQVHTLTSRLETCTQSMGGKNKKLLLDMKQQMDNFERDRKKMLLQAEQLSSDLENAREQVALKNRENLQLQEKILGLEEKQRDLVRQAKLAEDKAKSESTTRDSVDKRNMELELLLTKLRGKDTSDADFESTRAEVSRMLADLGQRVQEQLERQRGVDSDTRIKEIKRLEDLKTKVAMLESQLSQEQALHIVTKTQLGNIEEDNQNLRQQLLSARKRFSQFTETDRTKTRMEEINEIIAKSQSRAQQMLSSGTLQEDTLRALSPQPYMTGTSLYINTLSPKSDGNRSHSSEVDAILNGSPETMYRKKPTH